MFDFGMNDVVIETKVKGGPARSPVFIPGFDPLMEGGFVKHSLNLIAGTAGAGKTIFSMMFALNGVIHKQEPALFITLEESTSSLRTSMQRFGIEVSRHEDPGKLSLVDLGAIRQELTNDEEINDGGLLAIDSLKSFITQSVKLTGATRIVIDSLTALALRYNDVSKIRQDFFRLGRFFRGLNVTTLLTTEAVEGSLEVTRYGIEQFITDSFIYLRLKDVQGQGLIRTIQVRKARHTNHDMYEHPVIFTGKGIEVSPEKTFFCDF